jgi:iron complex outermembrane receptor protein
MLIIAAIMTVPLRAALADPLPAAETGSGEQVSEVIAESKTTAPMVLEPIVVEGEREPEPAPKQRISEAFIVPKDREPNTERTVPREGVRLLATPGQTNSFLAIQMLPSVNVQMTDPYGLSSQFSINIRGKTAFHLGRTVEDLPLNGVAGGIQGGFDLFDLENINKVTLYSGAVPLDHSFNPSNATGNLNLSILRPNDKFGVTYRQSNGSFDFNRTFGRIDTGLLPTKTKFYASYSYSYAHKWKGEGDSPTGRLNGEFGMVQELTQYAKLEVFGVVQDYRANTFQSLTYAQTGNLNAFRSLDFNPGITGKPNQDQLFYNFNTQAFYNYTLFSNLEVKPTSTSRFILKPYYWNNDGYTLTGVGGPFTGKQAVTRIDQNNYNWGVVAQYDAELFWGINGSLGYWHQTMQPPPPPTGQKAFFPLANGQLQFAGWSLLGKQSNYSFDTPYLIFKKQVGRFDGVAGLKYFYQQSPSFQGFQTTGLPDVPYAQVFNFNPKADPAMSVNATSFHQFLPYAGGTYAFTDRLIGRFIYGRNYGQANTGPTIQTFAMNEAAFKKVGLNLNDIVSPLQPEITDNFDLGIRYNDRKWFVAPTLFFTRVRNQEVFAFDPNVGVSYAVSTAKARNYGGELEVGAEPIDYLTVFGTASYFIYEFEDNVVSATKTQLNLTGNQVPDAPKWMAKLGATYDRYGFSASPVVQWLGSRWGDALNTQRVSDYYVVNGYWGYKIPERYSFGLKNLRLTGTFLNIFDRKYVSVISFNEFNLTGQTSYFAGPPFTAVVGLTASTF